MSTDRNSERTLGTMLVATSVLHGSDNADLSALRHPPPPPGNLRDAQQPFDASISATERGSLLAQSKGFAEDQWQRAYNMLHSNPTLMTSSVLCMALKRRAPFFLVNFMLKLNPEAASIPKEGPSPLQIAVQSSCNVDVIKALLEECPFALIATNPGSYLDPLSYAKRFRPTEADLIRLLSLPINHWIELKGNRVGDIHESESSGAHSYKLDGVQEATLPTTAPSHPILRSTRGTKHKTTTPPSSPTLNPIGVRYQASSDPTELNNIKLICLSVLKGHKRLTKEMLEVQTQVDGISASTIAATESIATAARQQLHSADITEILQLHSMSLMKKIQLQQRNIAKTQLVALEMKEQAMRASVRRMERRVMLSVQSCRDETMANVEIRLNAVVSSLQARLQNFTSRINRVESRAADRSNAGGQDIRTIADSRHLEMNGKKKKNVLLIDSIGTSPQTTFTASPSSFTYRSDNTWETVTETDDGPMPIFYASPLQKKTRDDDVRSLLSGEIFVDHPYRYRRPRRAVAVGKRMLHLLCKP